MSPRQHAYAATVTWTGNLGTGTSGYRAYSRDHEIAAGGKPVIAGSSDPLFGGDSSRYSPEDLLVASLAQCHMLWYLHLCADAGIVVTAYTDSAEGTMAESDDGSGRFTEVMLRPKVAVQSQEMAGAARGLHDRAHQLCFIANSVNFPVRVEPEAEIVTEARVAGESRPGT
jgi:organic hydroperoxide reductase OsmC/OhrA